MGYTADQIVVEGIPVEHLEDMEFVDALAETVNDNPLAFSNVCAILFGKEQRKRLYDFLRGDDGRVHITAVSDCIREVMDAIGDAGKN